MTTSEQREHLETLAESHYQEYDFGDLHVSDSDGWDTSDPADFTRIVYLEDGTGGDSTRASFHVRFNPQGAVCEVYALDMASGGYIGSHPIVFVPIGADGRIFEIDTSKLSKERGFVAITVELNGSTTFALTTDVAGAMAKVKELGGKIVDATTDFEEIINGQYDGLAFLTTEAA